MSRTPTPGKPIGGDELDRLLALVPPPPLPAADLANRIVARAAATPQHPALPRWRTQRPGRGRGFGARRGTWAGLVIGNMLLIGAAAAAALGGHFDFPRLAALSTQLFAHYDRAAPVRSLAGAPRRIAPPRATTVGAPFASLAGGLSPGHASAGPQLSRAAPSGAASIARPGEAKRSERIGVAADRHRAERAEDIARRDMIYHRAEGATFGRSRSTHAASALAAARETGAQATGERPSAINRSRDLAAPGADAQAAAERSSPIDRLPDRDGIAARPDPAEESGLPRSSVMPRAADERNAAALPIGGENAADPERDRRWPQRWRGRWNQPRGYGRRAEIHAAALGDGGAAPATADASRGQASSSNRFERPGRKRSERWFGKRRRWH